MKILSKRKPNVQSVVSSLLKKLKVNVSSITLNQNLEDHPEYPSLLAVSDCLTEWGIPNQSYLLDPKELDKDELLYPFIAHLKKAGGKFILVKKITNETVFFEDELTSNGELAEQDFLKSWTGVALHATSASSSGEQDYKTNRFRSQLLQAKLPILAITLLSFIYLGLATQQFSVPIIFATIFKLAGICISTLLLMQSINANNPFIKNLCSLGGKSDCNTILKSDAAKITTWLSWSEVGFFYFSGSMLCLLFNPSALPILMGLSLLALPYTIYSIGYQYSTKNWCVLCCIVQSLFALEAATWLISTPLQTLFQPIQLNTFLSTLLYFTAPIIGWGLLKPSLLKASQLKTLKYQLKKFKYNNDLFNQALKNQPRYAIGDSLMPIVLGNPNAENVITMVSNPFCGPCAKAHKMIDEWLKHRDDIQLKVIFMSANHEDEPRTKVSRHLSALSKNHDQLVVENALNDWYGAKIKNYDDWSLKHPVSIGEEVNEVTQVHKEWCEMAEIQFTPTILFNGYKLPEPYQLDDIKYLLN